MSQFGLAKLSHYLRKQAQRRARSKAPILPCVSERTGDDAIRNRSIVKIGGYGKCVPPEAWHICMKFVSIRGAERIHTQYTRGRGK